MKKKRGFSCIFVVCIFSVIFSSFASLGSANPRLLTKTTETIYEWGLPFYYAQTSWPTIHRDSRNSNYLPFTTTDQLKQVWQAAQGDQAAVMNSVVIGPEGNIYYTTGQEENYGNLHAYNHEGQELWRSRLLDSGALCSSPVIDWRGDIYLGDADEFFSFRPNGSLKWKLSNLEGPFPSAAITLDGSIMVINKDGQVFVFHPDDGQLMALPIELFGQSPGLSYALPSPPGLWEDMVKETNQLTINDLYNIYKGTKFKITKTPAINPINGKIFVVGTTKAENFGGSQGKLYGLDFMPSTENTKARLSLAFEKDLEANPASCPAISPDGLHVYLLDSSGLLSAFDLYGNEVWQISLEHNPTSVTIGHDGVIYTTGQSLLYAIKDLGSSGALLWEMDFNDLISQTIPESFPPLPSWLGGILPEWENQIPSWLQNIPVWLDELREWAKGIPDQEIKPAFQNNSLVSASRNHLYLTLALGSELEIPGSKEKFFFPLKNFLLTLSPAESILKPIPILNSMKELADTSDSILTLDSNGSVYCTHASVGSSIAYGISKKMGWPYFPKPIGGVTVFEPKNSTQLLSAQVKCLQESMKSTIRLLRTGEVEKAYQNVTECLNQLNYLETQLHEEKEEQLITEQLAGRAAKYLGKVTSDLQSAQDILEPMLNDSSGQKRGLLQAQNALRSAMNACIFMLLLF